MATAEPVKLNLGGREWNLVVTLGVLRAMERATGKDFLRLDVGSDGKPVDRDLSTDELTTLLWAMMRRENMGLTIDAVGDLVGGDDLVGVTEAVVEATRRFCAQAFPTAAAATGGSGVTAPNAERPRS